jgi:hypothetical protein
MIRDGKLKLRRFAGKSAIAITDVERLVRKFCPECEASLTEADSEAGECTNCYPLASTRKPERKGSVE